MTDNGMPAGPATVLDRLLSAGIDPDRAKAHLEAGAVKVDGHRVTNPATPCPVGTSRALISPQ